MKRRKKVRWFVKYEWPLLEGGALLGSTALIVCLFLISSIDGLFLQSSQSAAVVSTVLVDLANGDRSSQSLGALTISPVLVAAAQAKADDEAAKGYFAHVAPDGKDSWYWFKLVGYKFNYAGENLAVDFSDSADVNTAWMNSPSHRENIMNGHYTEIGIATAQGLYQGHPTTFVVQMFGTPSAAAAAVAITEESKPKSPTEVATASTQPQVLGEAAAPKPTPPKKPTPAPAAASTSRNAETIPAQAAPPAPQLVAGTSPQYSSAWGYVLASPKTTLRYAYYVIGFLILAMLAITTGLEWHWHHMRKVVAAGSMLALMFLLFIVADVVVFSTPTLALTVDEATQAR